MTHAQCTGSHVMRDFGCIAGHQFDCLELSISRPFPGLFRKIRVVIVIKISFVWKIIHDIEDFDGFHAMVLSKTYLFGVKIIQNLRNCVKTWSSPSLWSCDLKPRCRRPIKFFKCCRIYGCQSGHHFSINQWIWLAMIKNRTNVKLVTEISPTWLDPVKYSPEYESGASRLDYKITLFGLYLKK